MAIKIASRCIACVSVLGAARRRSLEEREEVGELASGGASKLSMRKRAKHEKEGAKHERES